MNACALIAFLRDEAGVEAMTAVLKNESGGESDYTRDWHTLLIILVFANSYYNQYRRTFHAYFGFYA